MTRITRTCARASAVSLTERAVCYTKNKISICANLLLSRLTRNLRASRCVLVLFGWYNVSLHESDRPSASVQPAKLCAAQTDRNVALDTHLQVRSVLFSSGDTFVSTFFVTIYLSTFFSDQVESTPSVIHTHL